MSKTSTRIRTEWMRRELVRRYPAAFSGKGRVKMPLKIGIFEDILADWPDAPAGVLRNALADYCHGPSYVIMCAYPGMPRLTLLGGPAARITVEEADHAIEKLRRMDALPEGYDSAAPELEEAVAS